jgi:hypothetical protein
MTLTACLVLATTGIPAGQATTDNAGAMQISKPTDRGIVMARTFAAPLQKIFDALTKPDQSL